MIDRKLLAFTFVASALLLLPALCVEEPAPQPVLAGAPAVATPLVGQEPVGEEDGPTWDLERLRKAGVEAVDLQGAHPLEPDRYHPDGDREVRPAMGGRVIQHIPSQPGNLNRAIENSALTTWMLYEMHAALVERDFETWVYEPVVASAYDMEDTVILEGGRSPGNGNILFGKVTEAGDSYVVESGSSRNEIETTRVPKGDVESVEFGTVFTFHLRDGVKWHDGHAFDAHDAYFSWEIYGNPAVDCDKVRAQFKEIVNAEVLDDRTIRYFYRQQYMDAVSTFGTNFFLMPRHLYDLHDPDHPRHDAAATEEQRAAEINDNPHNTDFVGLGPYRLKEWKRDDYIEAVRFEDFFWKDPAKAGYMDVLRWKYISNDDTAFEGLINGEVDIFGRIKTEDYFGEKTQTDVFNKDFYKAYTYTATYQYTGWNIHRTKLKDKRVRQALAHSFDSQGWVDSKYFGLAWPITGPTFFMTPNYDHSIPVRAYDADIAEELLAEAGWYDRDGNGIVDKDGEDLVIEILIPQGNKASESTVQKIQEGFSRVGVRVEMQPLEWASFLERIYNRDFDGCNLATVLQGGVETDPKLGWHSEEGAFDKRSSNHSGLRDEKVDAIVDEIRRTIDPADRAPLWRKLQAELYDLQPYLFMNSPPRKFAFNKKLRGVKLYVFAPGFLLRDMYYEEGTPGTRSLPAEFSRSGSDR